MKQFKSLSIYAFTIFFNAAISFGTFSLLTHYLSEVDYGIINLYTSFVVFLTPFIAVGVQFVLSVDYFKLNQHHFRNHFTNALPVPLGAALFFTLLICIFHTRLQNLLGVNFFFAFFLPATCLLIVINDIFLNLFRNKGEHFLFAGFSIIKNIIEVSLTILFVVFLSYKWEGRLGGSLLALVISAFFIVFLIYKWKLFTGAFSKKLIYTILISGLPFIPERLAIFVLGYSDRFFINHYSGTAEVGYYGAGAQLSLIVTLVIITLNNTFYPVLFRELSQQQIEYKKIRNTSLAFIGISFIITLGVIAAVPLFFKFFIGPVFQPGQKYAVYLAIGLFFWAIYNVFIAFLLSLKKNKVIMYISLFGMVISLISNFINVRHFGAIGATYTSILVYFFMAAGAVYFAGRYYNLRKVFAF
jgi:O-antigen/teichoic acid export membrane protein